MISILGNIGNAGFALPMVQAYPVNVNLPQLLAWNPAQQALDYVPYTGSSLGDFGVTNDLSVGRDAAIVRNATIGGTLGVVGASTFTGLVTVNGGIAATDGGVEMAGNVTVAGNLQSGVANVGPQLDATGFLKIGANQVVNSRKTGWVALTGTPLKTTFATGTITLPQLAGIVMALQADLITHGLIGA